MSVLVVAKNLRYAGAIKRTPVAELELPADHMEALGTWGATDLSPWEAITEWNSRVWDEHVNDAVNDAPSRHSLVRAIVDLAQNSDALALWYAGFPHDVPVVHSLEDLRKVLDAQLARGELEPAVRFVGSPFAKGPRNEEVDRS